MPFSSGNQVPPAAGHSGKGVWGTRVNDCYNGLKNNAVYAAGTCSNQNTADDSVLTLTLAIPAGFAQATLTFWHWTDVYYPWDWHEIRVNSSVVKQYCLAGYTKPTAWQKASLDLSGHIGTTVSVQWHFMASGAVNYAGWYIDDLRVVAQ